MQTKGSNFTCKIAPVTMNQIVAIAIVWLYIVVVPMCDSYISYTLVTISVSYLISTLTFGCAFLIGANLPSSAKWFCLF